MFKKKLKPFVYSGLMFTAVVLFTLGSYLLAISLRNAVDEQEDFIYVSYEVLTDNIVPVINETETVIIKPYNEEGIVIAKEFYDPKKEAKDQENAIIFYKDTYFQNTGVDYKKDTVFNVLAILNGKVISITEDEIVGKTVKIKHDNDIISIYQSLSEVNVKVDDEVTQGQTIGKSGENDISQDLGNHLHFELYIKNKLVNPEEYYNKSLGEA